MCQGARLSGILQTKSPMSFGIGTPFRQAIRGQAPQPSISNSSFFTDLLFGRDQTGQLPRTKFYLIFTRLSREAPRSFLSNDRGFPWQPGLVLWLSDPGSLIVTGLPLERARTVFLIAVGISFPQATGVDYTYQPGSVKGYFRFLSNEFSRAQEPTTACEQSAENFPDRNADLALPLHPSRTAGNLFWLGLVLAESLPAGSIELGAVTRIPDNLYLHVVI